jgi:hypothetical protein
LTPKSPVAAAAAVATAAIAASGWLAVAGGGVARAEDHVTVRGIYFREASTRVVQPVADLSKDLPTGGDVFAHYLLDAITSASAAAGPVGDNIFTEYRNEAGLGYGHTFLSRYRVAAAYKYSAESDYWSHTGILSGSARLWQDTATLAASFGVGRDQVGRRGQAAPVDPMGRCLPSPTVTCPLNTVFGSVAYSQILSPTVLVQVGYEMAWLSGYLASPYRMETVPDLRVRNSVSARVAKYFPDVRTGLQLHYRYYWDAYPGTAPDGMDDPWGLSTHTVEVRLYQRIGRDLELRLAARHYPQGPVNFWCDLGVNPSCNINQLYMGNSPQLGHVTTNYFEGKIYWDATALREVPFLGWFSTGTFELSYGRLLQDTTYGNAHVLHTGYHFPF